MTAEIIPYGHKRNQMKEKIETIVKEVFKDTPCDFVLLFGSHARGDAHAMSDIDIGVCTPEPLDLKSLGYLAATLETRLRRPVDLTDLYGLYRKNPLLAFEILSHHIPLCLRDEERYIHFKTMAQLSYLDHKPLIEANRRQLRRRIEEGKIGERNYA